MRWNLKFERDNPETYRCCLCCHVRTGTVILGLFHMVVHILVLSIFALVVMHPEMIQNRLGEDADHSLQLEVLKTSQLQQHSNSVQYIQPEDANASWMHKHQLTAENQFLGLMITLISFSFTIMLVYGAIKGQPSYLMPFFCLQVFDFCLSCLTIVGYFSLIPNIKTWIAAQNDLLFKEQLLAMDGDWLMLFCVIFFVLVLSIKAYLIGVVWSCYKYLTYTGTSSIVRTYDPEVCTEDAEMLLPPKYEDVLRMSAEEPAPPPYTPQTI